MVVSVVSFVIFLVCFGWALMQQAEKPASPLIEDELTATQEELSEKLLELRRISKSHQRLKRKLEQTSSELDRAKAEISRLSKDRVKPNNM